MPWDKLQQYLQKKSSIAIAFSGGLDSRFLAHAAKLANCKILLLHAQGVHMPTFESAYAKNWALQNGFEFRAIDIDVLSLEQVRNNSEKRCYYCKKHLMQCFLHLAKQENLQLCDGTNADDLKSHRPGLQALNELNILSPLAICNIDKAGIRKLGSEHGLDYVEQKARPCLLTRLSYDQEVSAELLLRIANAEYELEQAGLCDFRLRLCPKPLLQSIPHNLPEPTIQNILIKNGFAHAQIHISNDISGFFDSAKKF